MFNKKAIINSLTALSSALLLQHAIAAPYLCGSPTTRLATLDSAEACYTGSGNPKGNGSTVDSYFGADWTNVGSETDKGNTGQWFDVTLTSGAWDGGDAAGTWSIDSNFWNTYDDAVITLHVGHGKSGPDHWAWLLTDNETAGTWAYDFISGNGGGLSNLHLWGRDLGLPDTPVAEPGVLGLLALGVLGLARLRRKMA